MVTKGKGRALPTLHCLELPLGFNDASKIAPTADRGSGQDTAAEPRQRLILVSDKIEVQFSSKKAPLRRWAKLEKVSDDDALAKFRSVICCGDENLKRLVCIPTINVPGVTGGDQ